MKTAGPHGAAYHSGLLWFFVSLLLCDEYQSRLARAPGASGHV